ncbi:hypothetical protein CH366_02560 [Leptospira harrisiae]|nr:hypothetical protein CH366_02560 [Leptospira harrisiae]
MPMILHNRVGNTSRHPIRPLYHILSLLTNPFRKTKNSFPISSSFPKSASEKRSYAKNKKAKVTLGFFIDLSNET